MLKRLIHLISDSLAYGLSGVLGQLIGLLLLPLYTRCLQPKDYGVLAMLAYITPVVLLLASSGTKSAVFQQFYKDEDESHRRVVLSTAAISVFGSVLMIILVAMVLAPSISLLLIGSDSAANLVRVSLIAAAFTTITEVPLAALQAARRARTVGILSLVQLLLTVSLTILSVVGFKQGVWGVVFGTLGGACGWSIACFLAAAKFFSFRFDYTTWKEMAAYALPFLPHRLQGTALTFFSEYVVRTNLGLDQMGIYNVATRFGLPIGLLFGALHQAWNPYKFKVFSEEKNPSAFFRSTLTYFVFVLMYLWVGISSWGPEAVRLMTAPAFHSAAALVWAVALMRAAQAFYPLMATGIELSKNTRSVPLTSLASLVIAIICSLCLVPWLGAYGAALATTAAWLTMAAGFYIIGQKQVRIDYDWASVFALFGSAAFVVLLVWMVQNSSWAPRLSVVILATLLYPILGLVILRCSPSERHRVDRLLSKCWVSISRNSTQVSEKAVE